MKSFLSVLLTIACLIVGYGFYKMNHGDWINAVVFTIGILGLMMSVLRNLPKK
jgi:uncharacterized membrane protein YjjP (DUF1212 family)